MYIVSAPAGARWPVLGNNYTVNLVLCITPPKLHQVSRRYKGGERRNPVHICMLIGVFNYCGAAGAPCSALTMHTEFVPNLVFPVETFSKPLDILCIFNLVVFCI